MAGVAAHAVKTTVGAVSERSEVISYYICLFVSVAALFGFFGTCVGLVSKFDDTDATTLAGQHAVRNDNEAYLAMNSTMLWAWLALMAVLVLAWGRLRVLVMRCGGAIAAGGGGGGGGDDDDFDSLVDNADDGKLDTSGGAGHRTGHRYELEGAPGKGYLEIARPLEPYIGWFVLFSIPQVVMATRHCELQSDSSGAANCEAVCLAVLSLRTLVTTILFFLDRRHRVDLYDIRALIPKVWVRFWELNGLPWVTERDEPVRPASACPSAIGTPGTASASAIGTPSTAAAEDGAEVGTGMDYQLMGGGDAAH